MESKLFLDRQDIKRIVNTIGDRINKSVVATPSNPIVLLGIMDGAAMFMCDIAKQIKHPTVMLFAKCHSYNETSQGRFVFDYWPDYDFTGKHVIIVDEIIDTGNTMREVMQMILKNHEPLKIEICGLIKRAGCPCYVDYLGRQVAPEAWLFGYGMDYPDGMNRNLANIYIKS